MLPSNAFLGLLILLLSAHALAQTSYPDPDNCPCPPPPAGSPWQISLNDTPSANFSQPLAIQCAYPNGACVWDETGTLLNTAQPNCQPQIAANPTECPDDSDGASGALTARYQGFVCLFDDETGFHPELLCDYNPIGEPVNNAECPQAQLCSY